MWQPIANQYLSSTFHGNVADVYPANIVLPNRREGFVVTAWAYDPGNQTSFIPVNISILEQQTDGTLSVATPKYVADSQTNGSTSVAIADFNKDGIPDVFLPPYNETPNLPTSSIAYLSNANGTYSKVTVGDLVEAQDGVLALINGTPTVFTASYYATSSNADTATSFNGAGGFTIIPNTGVGANTSVAVADFYGTGEYSAVYGDFEYGPNFSNNGRFGIYGYHLSQLMASGYPFDVGNPYFDQPAYAGYQSFLGPNGTQSSFRIWTDDFNHDGMMDILVEGEIWSPTLNFQKDILQMFQNAGSYQFADVTDAFNPQFDKNCGDQDAVPQSRDIDGSGINSYLLSTGNYSISQPPCSYVIVNDGTGSLQTALYQTLNGYGKQVINWLLSPYGSPRNQVAAFPGYFIDTNSSPLIRAYQTPNGLLNFVAIVGGGLDPGLNPNAPVTEFFVNIPLQLDVSTQFTRPITIVNRNGSHLIRTFAGDDTIYSGNDGGFATVDGGLGTNTVVYSGPSQNYSPTHNSDGGWTIKDNVGTDGTDTLTRIQRLQFTDVVVNLAAPTTLGPAASIVFVAGASQSATVNTAFSTSLQVTVRDFLGNPVPNVVVTFSAPKSGASGTFPGSALTVTATTNGAGVATAPTFTANGITGTFTVTAAVAGVTAPAIFSLTNASLPTAPIISAVENSATGQLASPSYGVAPNSFISIYSSNIGTVSNPSLFPATDFQGLQVLFNGKAVPLYAITPSANQINVVVPSELPSSGTTSINVQNSSGVSQDMTLTLAQDSVGVFRIPDSSHPNNGAVVLNGTTWLVMPASTAAFYNFQPCTGMPVIAVCAQPAKPGDNIAIYFTGGGLATPNGNPSGSPVPTGSLSPLSGNPLYQTVETPTITIGGLIAPVQFSGIAPGTAAEYQLNTQIPLGVQLGDSVPVVVKFANSSDTVTIAVQSP